MAEGNSINTGRETLPQRGKVDKGKTTKNLEGINLVTIKYSDIMFY
jgi:hypothetical protein